MYVIESRAGGYAILHDLTAKELRQCVANKCEHDEFRPVSGVRAHRWVKAGNIHSTDLYVRDDGRIGKAGCGC